MKACGYWPKSKRDLNAEHLSCLKLGFASLCLLQSKEKAGKRGHGSKSPSFMATHKTQSS